MAVKARHQRPLHLIQPQVQQLSQEIQLKESSQCQPTACPLVKSKKTVEPAGGGGGRWGIGRDFDIFQKVDVKFPTHGQKCEVKYN